MTAAEILALADQAERTGFVNRKAWRLLDDRVCLALGLPSRTNHFCTSIDDCRAIADWLLLSASDIGADGMAMVRLGQVDPAQEVVGIGATLELAWLAAALRAKAAGL